MRFRINLPFCISLCISAHFISISSSCMRSLSHHPSLLPEIELMWHSVLDYHFVFSIIHPLFLNICFRVKKWGICTLSLGTIFYLFGVLFFFLSTSYIYLQNGFYILFSQVRNNLVGCRILGLQFFFFSKISVSTASVSSST